MPDIIGWVAIRGSKQANLLPLDHLSLTVKGSAPKFSKRTILAGLDLFLSGFLLFHPFFLFCRTPSHVRGVPVAGIPGGPPESTTLQ
jgi:hypothetical protein